MNLTRVIVLGSLLTAGCAALAVATPSESAKAGSKADAGMPPLPAIKLPESNLYQRDSNGALVPIFQPTTVQSDLPDGGWAVFGIIPAPDGGTQLAGCVFNVQSADGVTTCCRVMRCSAEQCSYINCERVK